MIIYIHIYILFFLFTSCVTSACLIIRDKEKDQQILWLVGAFMEKGKSWPNRFSQRFCCYSHPFQCFCSEPCVSPWLVMPRRGRIWWGGVSWRQGRREDLVERVQKSMFLFFLSFSHSIPFFPLSCSFHLSNLNHDMTWIELHWCITAACT